MTYQIKYYYQTGDSFGSQESEGILELEWNDLNNAKANLQRIKEHYQMYQELEDRRWNSKVTNQQIIQKYTGKDWLVEDMKLACKKSEDADYFCIDENQKANCLEKDWIVFDVFDETSAQHRIKLYADNGNVWQIWPPWCGYFERLHSAEIITKQGFDDMKIEF